MIIRIVSKFTFLVWLCLTMAPAVSRADDTAEQIQRVRLAREKTIAALQSLLDTSGHIQKRSETKRTIRQDMEARKEKFVKLAGESAAGQLEGEILKEMSARGESRFDTMLAMASELTQANLHAEISGDPIKGLKAQTSMAKASYLVGIAAFENMNSVDLKSSPEADIKKNANAVALGIQNVNMLGALQIQLDPSSKTNFNLYATESLIREISNTDTNLASSLTVRTNDLPPLRARVAR